QYRSSSQSEVEAARCEILKVVFAGSLDCARDDGEVVAAAVTGGPETWISAAEDGGSYNSQICRHALIVFDISIAIVIGPTPPGTGVIALSTFEKLSKSTSPTSL